MVKQKHSLHLHNECDATMLNEFEQARLKRIQHNKQVLADMGLENAAEQMVVDLKGAGRQRSKHKSTEATAHEGISQQAAPTRRSKRLANELAGVVEHV